MNLVFIIDLDKLLERDLSDIYHKVNEIITSSKDTNIIVLVKTSADKFYKIYLEKSIELCDIVKYWNVNISLEPINLEEFFDTSPTLAVSISNNTITIPPLPNIYTLPIYRPSQINGNFDYFESLELSATKCLNYGATPNELDVYNDREVYISTDIPLDEIKRKIEDIIHSLRNLSTILETIYNLDFENISFNKDVLLEFINSINEIGYWFQTDKVKYALAKEDTKLKELYKKYLQFERLKNQLELLVKMINEPYKSL